MDGLRIPTRLHAMDGCESHKRLSASGGADGRTFSSPLWLPREEVDELKDQVKSHAAARKAAADAVGVSVPEGDVEVDKLGYVLNEEYEPCGETWKAANGKEMSEEAKAVCDQTGLFVGLCRHSIVECLIEMVQSGELCVIHLYT